MPNPETEALLRDRIDDLSTQLMLSDPDSAGDSLTGFLSSLSQLATQASDAGYGEAARVAGELCAGKPCWKTRKTGFVYRDKLLTPDGALTATLKAGSAGKATIVVTAKGANLETPNPAAFTGPIQVQLQRADRAVCFEATYGAPFKKNKKGSFFDLAD